MTRKIPAPGTHGTTRDTLGPTPLPAQWIAMLHDGDTDERYDTPHGACMAYAIRSARAGRTMADYLNDLSNPRNTLGDYYRARDTRDARKRHEGHQQRLMCRDWAKATRYAADHPQVGGRREVHQRLAEIRNAVHSTAWTGRSGLRNKTVMLALLTIADSIGTVRPRVSTRTLCEDTPYAGRKPIVGALRALRIAGWATPDRADMSRAEASRYRLDTPSRPVSKGTKQGTALSTGGHLGPLRDTHVETTPRVDLGLAAGPHAAAIYAALCADVAASAAEVATQSGVSRPTAYRWLPRLEKLGLAARVDGGWVCGEKLPAEVAEDLGVGERVKRRADRHKSEREGFHGWVEARAADVER